VNFLRSLCFIGTLSLHLARSTATSSDLSKATKLKQLVFECTRSNTQWVTMALQTVESKDLQGVALHPNPDIFTYLEMNTEPIRQQWHDLDHLLVQFWTSHSIRPKVTYRTGWGGIDTRDYVPSVLPELTKGGLVDLVEYKD